MSESAQSIKSLIALGDGRHQSGIPSVWMLNQGGSHLWYYRYRDPQKGGKVSSKILGNVDKLATKNAVRDEVARLRALRNGLKNTAAPIMVSESDEFLTRTFAEVRDEYFSNNPDPEKLARVKAHAGALDNVRVSAISSRDIAKMLKPIWRGRNGLTPSKVLSHIHDILVPLGDKNPAVWSKVEYYGLESDAGHKTRHRVALAYADVPAFVQALIADGRVSARALAFIALTACRANEALGATWREFNLRDKTWTLPAERTKMGRAFVIPLSDAAIALLGDGGADESLIFPSVKGGQIADKTTRELAKEISGRDDMTQHGLRASFRSWGTEQAKYRELALELCVAHVEGSEAQKAYTHQAQLVEERRKIMDDWAAYVSNKRMALTSKPAEGLRKAA